jgi:hypothetical protein
VGCVWTNCNGSPARFAGTPSHHPGGLPGENPARAGAANKYM